MSQMSGLATSQPRGLHALFDRVTHTDPLWATNYSHRYSKRGNRHFGSERPAIDVTKRVVYLTINEGQAEEARDDGFGLAATVVEFQQLSDEVGGSMNHDTQSDSGFGMVAALTEEDGENP
jgi:hypothetical protein